MLKGVVQVTILNGITGKLAWFESLRLVPERVGLSIEGVVLDLDVGVVNVPLGLRLLVELPQVTLGNRYCALMLSHELGRGHTARAGGQLVESLLVGNDLAHFDVGVLGEAAHHVGFWWL